MKFSRNASANWKGSGKEGKGTVSTETTVLDKTPYSFKSRFEDGKGTNPEELLGAAHAGCFSMKLSFVLNEMGFTADNIDTTAKVTMEDGKITNVHLDLSAKIPDISEDDFKKAAKEAKENCPVSALFNTEITMDTKLG
ncbi:OsmC family peroxiredoxin [Echinicola strongylocentroti]|uniref:OsmC family peroxiredoxin n=1 Tax=Echinicola strongylocentroti TaxID=1795355 RepID=A0A2Z4IPJ6_9BACT|nr:OsmC family protein [Echinicola strongylocentroti]AWW32992.1 OsmC family peroxiredoxin [Echinicola strongylocentroti]